MTADIQQLAAEMQAEVVENARASMVLADATVNPGSPPAFRPDSASMDAFEAGVAAGFLETMRMLMRRGFLPGGDS